MKALEKLRDLLVSTDQIHNPRIGQFLPLDLEKIKKDLKLEEKAKENGSKQLPRATSADFDEVESNIITIILAERARCLNEFNDHLATYNERLAILNIEARLTQVTLAAKDAISDFKAQINQGQCDLEMSSNDLKEQEDHFLAFKREHNLKRPAHYPESKTNRWGVIAIISFIEIFLNAQFLAVGSELGLLGGFGAAIAITFINIIPAVGLFGSKIMPMIWHKNLAIKTLGAIVTVSYAIFIFTFNIFVAHYRDASAGAMPEQAAITAVSTFLSNPFAITDFNSWIMVGVGCIFSLIALLDGWGMDDPYPEYGHWDRLRRKAYDDYNDDKASLFDDLKETRDSASSALAKLKEDLIKRRQEHDIIITNRANLLTNFEAHQNHLESCGRELIAFYRARNQEARSSPSPKYFDQPWQLDQKALPFVPTPVFSDKHLDAVMAEANTGIQSAIMDVVTAYENAIDSIEQINSILNKNSNAPT